jgi:predicted transglutaminase-like cysteine proteinase
MMGIVAVAAFAAAAAAAAEAATAAIMATGQRSRSAANGSPTACKQSARASRTPAISDRQQPDVGRLYTARSRLAELNDSFNRT